MVRLLLLYAKRLSGAVKIKIMNQQEKIQLLEDFLAFILEEGETMPNAIKDFIEAQKAWNNNEQRSKILYHNQLRDEE